MTHFIQVNGFDRVGKSSMINYAKNSLPSHYRFDVVHWGGPKKDEDPYDRYFDYFSQDLSDLDFLFHDRGFLETYFFENSRKNNKISYLPIIKLLEICETKFTTYNPVVVKRDWEYIKPLHLEEIEKQERDVQSNEFDNIYSRMKEYCEYYKYFRLVYDSQFPLIKWVNNPKQNYNLLELIHVYS